jgi:hypothetical protein
MNCQIIQIEKDFLKLQVVSSKMDIDYSLQAVVQIQAVDYLLQDQDQKAESISFGKIIEQQQNSITVQLLAPQKFLLGKIVQINLVKTDTIFVPTILNSKIIVGEKRDSNQEQSFEFIPTVQIGELVTQGQKIGYLNVSTTTKHNFKHWILAQESGKIGKITLGDFKVGELIATIGKNNQLLGNQKDEQLTQAILLKTKSRNRKLNLISKETNQLNAPTSTLSLGSTNLIIDSKKQFLNSTKLSQNQLENTILIFITSDKNFLASTDFQAITFFDKYQLGQSIAKDINNLAINICQTGYSVVIISQSDLSLNCGDFKTINGEDVSITVIIQDTQHQYNPDYFDNVLKLN